MKSKIGTSSRAVNPSNFVEDIAVIAGNPPRPHAVNPIAQIIQMIEAIMPAIIMPLNLGVLSSKDPSFEGERVTNCGTVSDVLLSDALLGALSIALAALSAFAVPSTFNFLSIARATLRVSCSVFSNSSGGFGRFPDTGFIEEAMPFFFDVLVPAAATMGKTGVKPNGLTLVSSRDAAAGSLSSSSNSIG